MNYSPDRRYNIDNYNNTIGINRSISNSRLHQNRNYQNNRFPLSMNSNDINNNINNNYNFSSTLGQQRAQTEGYDKTRGPYGVRFDEMETHMKLGQKQLKNDLEYLINLKNQRHGDMSQEEWEAYNRKLHYMNDVKNIFLNSIFLFYSVMHMVN